VGKKERGHKSKILKIYYEKSLGFLKKISKSRQPATKCPLLLPLLDPVLSDLDYVRLC